MKNLLLLTSLLVCVHLHGQDTLTLQQCADLMMKNSGLIISENASFQRSEQNRKLHYWTLLPTLSTSVGVNSNFGRRVDPFTNTFATNQVNSQSFAMNTSIPLFNGLSYIYTKRKLDLALQLTVLEKEQKQNEYLIRLMTLYENACKLQLQLTYSSKRIELLENIQESQRALLHAGRLASVDTLKSHNSLLNEQFLQLGLQNELRLTVIELNYFTGLPLKQQNCYSITSIPKLTTKPQINEEIELSKLSVRQKSATEELGISRSAALPSLSLTGNMGTGFSTNNKDFSLQGAPTKPYNDQIKQNLYEGIGIYLSIPIINRGEWLKAKNTNRIQTEEIVHLSELNQLEVEKIKLESEQKILARKAELTTLGQIASNLEMVYHNTLELYEIQRATYTDLENALIDWQARLLELETKKLEYESLLIRAQ